MASLKGWVSLFLKLLLLFDQNSELVHYKPLQNCSTPISIDLDQGRDRYIGVFLTFASQLTLKYGGQYDELSSFWQRDCSWI